MTDISGERTIGSLLLHTAQHHPLRMGIGGGIHEERSRYSQKTGRGSRILLKKVSAGPPGTTGFAQKRPSGRAPEPQQPPYPSPASSRAGVPEGSLSTHRRYGCCIKSDAATRWTSSLSLYPCSRHCASSRSSAGWSAIPRDLPSAYVINWRARFRASRSGFRTR